MSVSDDERDERPEGIYAYRRMVSCADDLRGNREFKKRIRSDRNAWDNKYPEWKAKGAGLPDTQTEFLADVYVPQSLGNALRGKTHLTPVETEAMLDWMNLVDAICEDFFPETNFPRYERGVPHPARRFVSLCLCFELKLVPPSAIRTFGLALHGSVNSPDALNSALSETLLVLETLAGVDWGRRTRPNRGLSPEELDGVIHRIREMINLPEGDPFLLQRESKFPQPGDYLYIPVPSVLVAADLTSAAPSIAESCRKAGGGWSIDDRICALYAAKRSVSNTALRLGISRTEVRRTLRERGVGNDGQNH